MSKILFWLIPLFIWSLVWGPEALEAGQGSLKKRLLRAEHYLNQGEVDFAFMEFRALLSEAPEGPLAEKARFAIGEYHFLQHNTYQARQAFHQFSQTSESPIPNLIAHAYLLECARFSKDIHHIHVLETYFREIFLSKKIFLAFEEAHIEEWVSPLGNRFQVQEFVNRMEIIRNGSPFCSVTFP